VGVTIGCGIGTSGLIDGVVEALVTVVLCFLEGHPPSSIKCLQQTRQVQSSAIRLWPHAAMGYLIPVGAPAVDIDGPLKVESMGRVGEVVGD
jgi:hypothetical protein